MSQRARPVIRRWDGKLKEATVWNKLARDPELSAPGADCFVYLSHVEAQSQQPSFIVPFQRLVWFQCQPLIKNAAVGETHPEESSTLPTPPRTSRRHSPRSTCTLLLEAPDQYNSEEVMQYHITTRNFFACIMERPLVGPDPASALLALKVRMDLWRTPSVDNFATLHHYAKTQGYGDLGEVQTYLRNHLRGFTAEPTGYKLLDNAEHIHVGAPKHRKNSLKDPIPEPAWWTQLRGSRHPNHSSSSHPSPVGSVSDWSEGGTDGENEEIVMSGAIPPPKDIRDPSMTTYLPMMIHERSEYFSAGKERSSAAQTPMTKTCLEPESRPRYQSRIWSMPNLHHPNDNDIPPVLHRHSSWVSNLCRERTESSATQQQALSKRSTATPSLKHDRARAPQRHSLSVPRHGQSTSYRGQPSPIMEEASISAVQEVSASARAGVSKRSNHTSIIDPGSVVAKLNDPDAAPEVVPPTSALAGSTPLPPPSITRHCPRAVLPSHSILVCKTCQKPKAPSQYGKQMRQQLTSTSPKMARPLSLPAASTSSKPDKIVSSHHALSQSISSLEQYLEANTFDEDEDVSRFPSLKNRSHSAKVSKTSLTLSSAREDGEYTASRRDPLGSEMVTSSPDQNEKPAGKFGGSSFAGVPQAEEPYLRYNADDYPQQHIQSMAAAPPIRTSTKLSKPSKTSTTAKQPQRMLRIDCQENEPESDGSTPISSLSGSEKQHLSWGEPPSRSHRVPLDEQYLGMRSTETMDALIREVITLEGQLHAKEPLPLIVTSAGDTQSLSDWKEARKSKTQVENLQRTKSLAKQRMRNGLKIWNNKKLRKEAPSVMEYQGFVLCLDGSGKFSMVPSPAESFVDDTQDYPFERSKTPLCELG
ncbi:hypothetical protein PMZ80_006498 [Knufia obscura]|uniref:Uncharacterized protein n=2 Tax=Knufia TaxID=430999 RepID=A0AAN8EL68_9EURO|nr:hypothetical protein PMZ80_006498 [Knufia obscura]KAK5953352.1 hypothetical protein OHC33_005296 [Knufia fluminis]